MARRRLAAGPGTGEFFAADDLDGPLVVRRAQADERFVPFGRTRAAQLGRFLSKQGVSNDIRKHPTVLADAGGILWVVGVRRSARAPVTAAPGGPSGSTRSAMTESQPTGHPEAAGPSAGRFMRVMFTAEQIARRVRELGLELARDYQDKRPLFVGVLKGACMFQCDLARATPIDLDLDFVSVSSYGAGKQSSGNVRLLMDLREDVADRHVRAVRGRGGLRPERVVHPRRDEAAAPREPARWPRCSTRCPAAGSRCRWTTAGWKIGSEFVVGYGMDDVERLPQPPLRRRARGGRIVTEFRRDPGSDDRHREGRKPPQRGGRRM